MKILLVNPPNCGRSIPEERYGLNTLKQIFRGEPLGLEVLASYLPTHEVKILDLKAAPEQLPDAISNFSPDIVGFTAMTCEANTVITLAGQIKQITNAKTVVGGIHASNDPEFFNKPMFDYVVIGLGQRSLPELVQAIENEQTDQVKTGKIHGIAATNPNKNLIWTKRKFSTHEYVTAPVPSYNLTTEYRDSYFLPKLNVHMGYVVTAYGCPFNCSFCSIAGLTGGKYLCHGIDNVVRDLQALPQIPFIRLVDANTFGSIDHACQLCQAIKNAGIRKNYLIDVRADTVVHHPEVIEQWQQIGLRSVVIGFEEISDKRLTSMNKQGSSTLNEEALAILNQLGVTVVGDFIVDPDYDENDFDQLENYIYSHKIDLPMLTIMTPLPGTALYTETYDKITEFNLDYYTLTNAVTATTLTEERFYSRYADLMQSCHNKAKI
ncbi:MAG: B12-binding domain-containing radical SAM protein [Desulfobacteraceae bacterium 4572_35.1]|nr:MAG: B12-binding domain-containing radical SAM protein [Desulfobacteraceae bacterium 4572_35.1]